MDNEKLKQILLQSIDEMEKIVSEDLKINNLTNKKIYTSDEVDMFYGRQLVYAQLRLINELIEGVL